MDKDRVAEILAEIGTLLELKGENPFKTRAYENAARTLESLTEPLEKLTAENRLSEIKGIGEGIQKKITELVSTGKLAYYDDLKASVPPGLVEMLQIPGLGPKKVKALNDKLGIETIEQLEAACQAAKIAGLDGFGEKTQSKILEGIQFKRAYASRHLLSDALTVAEPMLENLRGHPDVIRCSTAGSVRRFKEIIGDIDFLVSSKNPEQVIEFFTSQPAGMSVSAKGDTQASVILQGGIQADLRVVTDAEFPFALAYFTGSKDHNIVMRQRAIERGLRLNEYGLFKSKEETRDAKLRVPCKTEEDIFQKLDLAYIPPDGKLDFPDDLLAELDVVVASIHQGFSHSEAEMTKRIIRAARNPYVHILGHLTGRLLLEREPYKLNQHAVIDACAETGTWIELNANPYRFDLDWRLWPYAKSKGVKCVINCDAHRNEQAGFLRLGAGIARKGWLTKADVINTLPLKSLLKELNKKRTGLR